MMKGVKDKNEKAFIMYVCLSFFYNCMLPDDGLVMPAKCGCWYVVILLWF